MNKVAAFALRRKNSILSMSEKMFCPSQPLRFWITPAYAGKRKRPKRWVRPPKDHPRVCGEKLSTTSTDIHPAGSPPRMRGKGAVLDGVIPALRITPAYAGKRAASSSRAAARSDHPRVCGEKCPPGKFFFMTVGSPPPVRGKVIVDLVLTKGHRITPACAGKSNAAVRFG